MEYVLFLMKVWNWLKNFSKTWRIEDMKDGSQEQSQKPTKMDLSEFTFRVGRLIINDPSLVEVFETRIPNSGEKVKAWRTPDNKVSWTTDQEKWKEWEQLTLEN